MIEWLNASERRAVREITPPTTKLSIVIPTIIMPTVDLVLKPDEFDSEIVFVGTESTSWATASSNKVQIYSQYSAKNINNQLKKHQDKGFKEIVVTYECGGGVNSVWCSGYELLCRTDRIRQQAHTENVLVMRQGTASILHNRKSVFEIQGQSQEYIPSYRRPA